MCGLVCWCCFLVIWLCLFGFVGSVGRGLVVIQHVHIVGIFGLVLGCVVPLCL